MMICEGAKIHGTIKASKNVGSGDAGYNDIGKGDGRFDEDSGSRDAVIEETTVTETWQRCRTKMAVKGVVLWRTM